jgi:ubiquinone biosynthesis protein
VLDVKRALQLIGSSVFLLLYTAFWRVADPGHWRHRSARLFRQTLETLGVTYVKLGQFLAMRSDLVSPRLRAELGRLFENGTRMPFAEVKEVIEEELGCELGEAFATFSELPLGSASIAQVHRAVLWDGRSVAVKVQRLKIQLILSADLRNLRRLARLGDALQILGALSVAEVVDEFANWTWKECDFRQEGAVAKHLLESALAFEVIPLIVDALSTTRVLTMQFMEGVSLHTLSEAFDSGGSEGLARLYPGLDPKEFLHNLATASFHQIFTTGYFHGDPHPGNILIRRNNSIAFVDFGVHGQLSERLRSVTNGLVQSVATGDITRTYWFFTQLASPTARTDLLKFQRECLKVIRDWHSSASAPNRQVSESLGRYLGDLTEVVRRNHARMDVATLLFWRALLALDAASLAFGPNFDLLAELRFFFFDRSKLATARLAAQGALSTVRSMDQVAFARTLRGLDAQLATQLRSRVTVSVGQAATVRIADNRRAGALAASIVAVGCLLGISFPASLQLHVVFWVALLASFITVVHQGRLRRHGRGR